MCAFSRQIATNGISFSEAREDEPNTVVQKPDLIAFMNTQVYCQLFSDGRI